MQKGIIHISITANPQGKRIHITEIRRLWQGKEYATAGIWKEPSSPNLIYFTTFQLKESRNCHFKKSEDGGFEYGRRQYIFLQNVQTNSAAHPSLPFNVYRVLFPGGRVKQPKREVHHSPQSSTEVTNDNKYTATPL